MKKIYALIACAAMAVAMSVSAQQLRDFTRQGVEPHHAFTQKVERTNLPTDVKNVFRAPSRAEEEGVDVTKFTCSLYYDYFFNWYEYEGTSSTEREEWLALKSSTDSYLEWQEDGTILLKSFFGYTQDYFVSSITYKDPVLTVTEDGRLVAELGQSLFTFQGCNYYLASIDEDGNLKSNGEIEFQVYLDGIVWPDYIGIYADDPDPTYSGWYKLAFYYMLLEPNADITYVDSNSETQTLPIYAEYYEADPDSDDLDTISVYRITNAFDTTVQVDFITDEGVALAYYQIGAPYEYMGSDLGYSGSWYLVDATEFSQEVYGEWDADTMTLTFTDYSLYCTIGYWIGQNSDAKVVFRNNAGGIGSVAVDENIDAAPVYYNLQGMQVANPENGKIYIVKQGNKTTKQIFR